MGRGKRTKKKALAPAAPLQERDFSRVLAWIAVITLLVVVIIRIRLLRVPLERDEGEYAYMGQLILDGVAPYLAAYNMKFPGTYVIYAIVMGVLGQSTAAIRTGLVLANLASTVLLWFIARKVIDSAAAWIGAAIFLVLSLTSTVYGAYAHATNFLILFALGGILCLIDDPQSHQRRLLIFLGGTLLGASVLVKQHAVFFVMFGVFLVVARTARSAAFIRSAMANLATLLLGVIVPLAAAAIWLLRADAFERFWMWAVIYARAYVTQLPLDVGIENLRGVMSSFSRDAWLAGLLLPAGIAAVGLSRRFRPARPFAFGFLAASFLATTPGFYFRGHYFVVMLPAAALFIAAAVRWMFAVRGFSPVAVGILVLTLGGVLMHDRELFFRMTPAEASRETQGMSPFPEAIEVARFVAERTSPSDTLAVLGSEPEIYFHAHRRGATGYIYTYPLMENQPYASRMQREMISEIEANQPRIAVVVTTGTSWTAMNTSDRTIFNWTESWIPLHYRLIGIADSVSEEETVYRWGPTAASYQPGSKNLIMVWERK